MDAVGRCQEDLKIIHLARKGRSTTEDLTHWCAICVIIAIIFCYSGTVSRRKPVKSLIYLMMEGCANIYLSKYTTQNKITMNQSKIKTHQSVSATILSVAMSTIFFYSGTVSRRKLVNWLINLMMEGCADLY